MIERGSVYWSDLGEPAGSRPAKRRPVLVVSADTYNASNLATVIAVVITSKTALAAMPGNVFLPAASTGLPKDSVVNVTAVATVNKADLDQHVGRVPQSLVHEIDRGLRASLALLAGSSAPPLGALHRPRARKPEEVEGWNDIAHD